MRVVCTLHVEVVMYVGAGEEACGKVLAGIRTG